MHPYLPHPHMPWLWNPPHFQALRPGRGSSLLRSGHQCHQAKSPPQQAPDSETGQLPLGCPPLPFPGLEGRVGRRVSSLLSWGFGLDPLPFPPGSQRNQCAPM